jgi:hypothetical protein
MAQRQVRGSVSQGLRHRVRGARIDRATLDFYNRRRPHASPEGSAPDHAYFTLLPICMQLNSGRRTTYRRGNSVQTTAATSMHDALLPPVPRSSVAPIMTPEVEASQLTSCLLGRMI